MQLIALSFAAPVEPLEWIQIACTGRWEGYQLDGRRRPFAITLRDLEQMVANFEADPRGRVVMDWEHQTLHTQRNGQPAPAVAWITGLQVRPLADGQHGLFAQVEWTARGHTWVAAKEYSFVSPVIVFNATDRVTATNAGTRLHSVALTNNPFLQELPAVAATEPTTESTMLTVLLSLLALPESATEPEAVTKVTALTEGRKRVLTELELPETATPVDIEAAWNRVKREAAVGRVALTELSIPADLDGPTAAAAALPALRHSGYITATAHAAVVEELAALKADLALRDAMADGKVVPATEAWARSFALRAPQEFAAWAKVAPAVAPPATERRERATPAVAGVRALTDTDRQVARQLGLTDEQFANVPQES